MNETQAEFIKHAAAAIEDIIADQSGPCEIVYDDIWGKVCWVCSIGGAAQEIKLYIDHYVEDHPEIYE